MLALLGGRRLRTRVSAQTDQTWLRGMLAALALLLVVQYFA